MLSEILDYIEHNNIVVTSRSGGGTTSFILYLCNLLLNNNKSIVYFNPLDNIERSFIKEFYKNVYNDCIFINSGINNLLTFLEYTDQIDYLVLDPGDCLLYNNKLLPLINGIVKSNLICSSQIRLNPKQGGKPYSTLEDKYMDNIFNFSIWIRSITENNSIFNRKYVDIFDSKRNGNNYIARFVANYTKEGHVLND